MRKVNRIEEPPPIQRSTASSPVRHGPGVFADWRRRFFREQTRPRFRLTPGPGAGRAIAIALAAVTVIGLQAWTLHGLSRVRNQLAVAGAELDQARISLGLLWQMTEKLDEDQIAGLTQLADSIRTVFSYAQGEVRLWEAAFYEQEQRLEANAVSISTNADAIGRMATAANVMTGRLDALARADELKATRLAALERQDRTHAEAFNAIARRSDVQEATLMAVSSDVGSLRETLAGMDAEIVGLEDQLTSAGSAFGEMDTRIAQLDGWIDGFRRAGLSGEAVRTRLSTLADELRRVRTRVDSLRRPGPTVGTGQQQDH